LAWRAAEVADAPWLRMKFVLRAKLMLSPEADG